MKAQAIKVRKGYYMDDVARPKKDYFKKGYWKRHYRKKFLRNLH